MLDPPAYAHLNHLSDNELCDRLRGIYTIPVNDGAGPLNGKDTFTREFPGGVPIQYEAAARLEAMARLLAGERAKNKVQQEMILELEAELDKALTP